MTNAAQLSFPFDLTPCGPVVEAAARRAVLAGIADKLDRDDELGLLDGDDDADDFGGEEETGGEYEEEDYADAAE